VEEQQDTINLHGTYVCNSGSKYKYFGKCTSWMPGAESTWEIYLCHHDKEFNYDGVFNSPDLLAKLSGPLVNIRMDVVLVRQLAISTAEHNIEEWDNSTMQGGANQT
jgi:hypothetical protein